MPDSQGGDPTVRQIDQFVEYVSRLTLSDRVQRYYADGAAYLSRSELLALRVLGQSGPLTYRDLAGVMGLDPTTVSRLTPRLLEAGLVARESHAEDRRKSLLTLSAQGKQALRDIERIYMEYYSVAIADWTPERREFAREVLASLQDNLSRLVVDEDGRATRLASPDETPSS